jgi:ribonuclease R
LITPLNRQKTGGRREAKIVRIVERTYSKIVGSYEKQNGFGFVITDNKKIADDIYVS